jgi:hypothetical protein
MEAHIQISVKDFQLNKNHKIPLAWISFARNRQFSSHDERPAVGERWPIGFPDAHVQPVP